MAERPFLPLFNCDGSLLFTTPNYKRKKTDITNPRLEEEEVDSRSASKVLLFDVVDDYTLLLIDESIPSQGLTYYNVVVQERGEPLGVLQLSERPVYVSMNRDVVAIFHPNRISIRSHHLCERAIFNSVLFESFFSLSLVLF